MRVLMQVAKATLSDANVMLDSTLGAADQFGASSTGTFEEPVRERFKAAAAVSPRFLLLDFRYCGACAFHSFFEVHCVERLKYSFRCCLAYAFYSFFEVHSV